MAAQSHLFVTVAEVHQAVIIAIEMRVLGCIDWQQQIIDAQTVSLCIGICMNARVQQFVVGRQNACSTLHETVITVCKWVATTRFEYAAQLHTQQEVAVAVAASWWGGLAYVQQLLDIQEPMQ